MLYTSHCLKSECKVRLTGATFLALSTGFPSTLRILNLALNLHLPRSRYCSPEALREISIPSEIELMLHPRHVVNSFIDQGKGKKH